MRFIVNLMLVCQLLYTGSTYASEVTIKLFQKDSYQQILSHYQDQPMLLILWSINCSACLAEMELIHQIHQQSPKLNIIMLSVDGPEFHQEMTQIIKQDKLTALEHWSFFEDNSPVLRYAIDSHWYGELPRTYFFDGQHKRTGVSGVLSYQQYEAKIAELMLATH